MLGAPPGLVASLLGWEIAQLRAVLDAASVKDAPQTTTPPLAAAPRSGMRLRLDGLRGQGHARLNGRTVEVLVASAPARMTAVRVPGIVEPVRLPTKGVASLAPVVSDEVTATNDGSGDGDASDAMELFIPVDSMATMAPIPTTETRFKVIVSVGYDAAECRNLCGRGPIRVFERSRRGVDGLWLHYAVGAPGYRTLAALVLGADRDHAHLTAEWASERQTALLRLLRGSS